MWLWQSNWSKKTRQKTGPMPEKKTGHKCTQTWEHQSSPIITWQQQNLGDFSTFWWKCSQICSTFLHLSARKLPGAAPITQEIPGGGVTCAFCCQFWAGFLIENLEDLASKNGDQTEPFPFFVGFLDVKDLKKRQIASSPEPTCWKPEPKKLFLWFPLKTSWSASRPAPPHPPCFCSRPL